jgi:hypothetical protein
MTHSSEDIYNLLPAIYRIRDEGQGGPLRALVNVLAKQASIVESDIATLHENWFIETCEEWVVPYLGDLLGVRGLHPVSHATFSLRGLVANTLAYRRRKGTATVLEQLARDSTNWPAHAVEFFELLDTTQYYNHLRPHNVITPDLRRTEVLELLDTPFDRIAHTADVRHIASRRGKHNIPSIGLFLWRLQSYPLTGVTAQPVAIGQFTFSPLGLDARLFNNPEPETEITHLAEEINVPGALRRRPLYDELEARRQAMTDDETPETLYFGADPVFQIFPNAGTSALEPKEILICDLSDWRHPAASKGYNKSSKLPYKTTDSNLPDQTFPIAAAVDPVLGRITFPPGVTPSTVFVDFAYGFSGDLGGGPYDRSGSIAALRTLGGRDALVDSITWWAGVSKTLSPGLLITGGTIFSSVAAAVAAWNSYSVSKTGEIGSIAILDSQTYLEDLTVPAIEIPDGCQLLIFAADLPAGGPLQLAAPKDHRPHLRSNISVVGRKALSGSSDTPGELILNGLLIEGDVAVAAGYLGGLRIDHCTLVMAPGAQPLTVASALDENSQLVLRLERTICGTIALPASVKQLQVKESIVDGDGGIAIQAPEARADLEASTFFGTVTAKMLEASNSIFTKTVTSELRQAGCVRFCFLTEDSVTPRRYRCQPDLALKDVTDAAAQQSIRSRIKPSFTSNTYGQPGYAQLKLTVPAEITRGADDGAEMGAFCFLKQPQREANLRASLDEYLRFGLEAGIFYAT